MKTTIRRILAAAVSAVMMIGFATVGAYAAELSYRDLNGVTWSYAVDGETALTLTLVYADGSTQTLTRRITVG